MLAATALVVLPPATTAPARQEAPAQGTLEVEAIVTKVTTTSVHGLFRTELELSPRARPSGELLPSYRFVAWGGTIAHVRQVIGGVQMPEAGERVALSLEPVAPAAAAAPAARSQDRAVRAMTRLAQ